MFYTLYMHTSDSDMSNYEMCHNHLTISEVVEKINIYSSKGYEWIVGFEIVKDIN
jgi:hypothetical protein